jgi:hypothetical protein
METASIVDQLKQMHRAVHANNADFYRLPNSHSQIAEYLLLYEMGGGKQLEQFVSFNYDIARIQVRTKALGLIQIKQLENDINQYLTNKFTTAVVTPTGTLTMFRALGEHVANGQVKSFIFALCAIAVIMVIVLRSLTLGIIAMVPNVLPIIIALGTMGLVNAELNLTMMVLAPMILGVAVDDSIHFFICYRHCFDKSSDYTLAYRETMRTVGRPILFTTLVLITGFSGFLLSDFNAPRSFAWASGLAFFSALIADFMLVPLLLRWLKPLGRKEVISTEIVK